MGGTRTWGWLAGRRRGDRSRTCWAGGVVVVWEMVADVVGDGCGVILGSWYCEENADGSGVAIFYQRSKTTHLSHDTLNTHNILLLLAREQAH